MYNSQSLSKNNLIQNSSIEADIQMSSEEYNRKYCSNPYISRDEETYQQIKNNLDLIAQKKLQLWQNQLDENKKFIDEGRKYQDNLPQNSATNWQITMQDSFANHYAKKNPSTSQLDHEEFQLGHEALGNRAFQYLVETPSSVSDLDGSRNYSDMPARRLDFTPVKSVPFATRLV